MATLWITRGLPASGKTSWARATLASRPPGQIVRLNRDDLRRMGLPGGYHKPERDAEQRITTARDAALRALLESGCDVIVDDTNLRAKYVRSLMEIADRAGATMEVVDFTDVPMDECVRRDQERVGPERVGEIVIRDMHSRYLAQLGGGPLPVPEIDHDTAPVPPYAARPGTPPAVLVDLDGTLALLDRNPYDETYVFADRPNTAVIETTRALAASGVCLVFMSGRTEGCRVDTERWLQQHVLIEGTRRAGPFMRTVGDTRPDHVVKLELFDRHVRDHYDVRVVLDDRDSVVALWRSLGLTCLQVAPGDF